METNTHGLNILVDPAEGRRNARLLQGDSLLVQWVMEHVNEWEQWRNTNYSQEWDEYYRIWRTEYSEEDKERLVERSMIMPTALSESVGEIAGRFSDAFFSRKSWFDASDNPSDPNSADVKDMAAKLRYDMDKSGLQTEVDKCLQYGALYGTYIMKATVGTKDKATPQVLVDQFGREVMGGVQIAPEVYCSAVAVSPREFVIDPAARTIGDALGCAHIVTVPKHTVTEAQRKGVYRKGVVGDWSPSGLQPYTVELSADNMRDKVRLVEYHGLVPKALLPGSKIRDKSKIVNGEIDDSIELVEAIVTIANDSFELKAVENPFLPVHRSFFASQHETVPDSFWGRGAVEAGYHPYKALQTEIRARADGLALANYPTIWRDEGSMSGESTRDDPDEKIIQPGKEYLVAGDPNRAIREFKFSGPDRGSSQAIADYERMINQATRSFGFRAALNIERDLLGPLIEAIAWRSMQYKPKRYPPIDFSFTTEGAIGILQQEEERTKLVELMTAIPPESPAFYAIMKLIIESGPYEQRSELLAIVDGLIASALNPPPPPPDLGGQARLISAEQRVREWEDEKVIKAEEFKRQDVELMIKAKQTENKSPAPNERTAEEVNINLNSGRKRVVIRRTDEGLVGETEELN